MARRARPRAGAGLLLGLLHGLLCNLPRVNDIAVGIGLMLFGTGLAFFLGKPYVQPKAPTLARRSRFGAWSSSPQIRAALAGEPAASCIGIALAVALGWAFRNTRWGLVVRMVGDSADAARAMGHDVARVRALSTALGGLLAGIGGSFLSLYYPGSWSEGLSSGQGLMAVALVIFARWNPLRCFYAALLFGGAGALGPGAPVGRIHVGLLPLQCRAVRRHARHHDRDLLAPAHAGRRARRAEHHR